MYVSLCIQNPFYKFLDFQKLEPQKINTSREFQAILTSESDFDFKREWLCFNTGFYRNATLSKKNNFTGFKYYFFIFFLYLLLFTICTIFFKFQDIPFSDKNLFFLSISSKLFSCFLRLIGNFVCVNIFLFFFL